MSIDETAHGLECVDERGRQNQIADSQSWKKHLAEGANIDHTPRLIEPMQGRQWAPGKAIFAVIVILQNISVRMLGPLQQRQTALQTHGDAQRELVRRRDIDQPGLRGACYASFHYQALLI